MLLHLTDLSSEPIHKQISRQLAEKILAGDLAAGEKLPSARTLARTQHVNVHTVERAYRNLESDELIAITDKNSAIVKELTAERKHAIALRMLAGEGSPLSIVKAVSDELISVFEPAKLARIFANNLKRHLLVKHVYFTTHHHSSNQFAILPVEENQNTYLVARNDDTLVAIQKTTIPVSIDELELDAASDLHDELMTRNIRMIVPLHSETGFLGFIALTGKVTGTPFSYHEIMLLTVLARQFVAALNTSRLYVEMLEKRRMEEEFSVARQIQQDLLPKELPGNGRFQLAAYSQPSQAVGGDFYDYLPIDKNRFGLVIADASGKGMPAALLISQIQAILKSEVSHGNSIRQTLASLNKHLKQYSSAQNFATLFYGMVDLEIGILEYANAGHNYPILTRKNGKVEILQTTGPALGILQNSAHDTATIQLKSGDNLLLYTDGVTETMNSKSEEFGEQQLQRIFDQSRTSSAQEILDKINKYLAAFEATGALQDDRTMVVLKVLDS